MYEWQMLTADYGTNKILKSKRNVKSYPSLQVTTHPSFFTINGHFINLRQPILLYTVDTECFIYRSIWHLPPCRVKMPSFNHLKTDCVSLWDCTYSICVFGQACDNSHMLAVAVSDLVSDGVLVGQVLIVEEMLPALGLVEVSYLGWWSGRRRGQWEFSVYLEWRWRVKQGWDGGVGDR